MPFVAPSKVLYDELIFKIKQNNSSYLVNACFLEMIEFTDKMSPRLKYLYDAILELNEPFIINIVNQHIFTKGMGPLFNVKEKQYEYLIPEYSNEENKQEVVLVNLYPMWVQVRDEEAGIVLKGVKSKEESMQSAVHYDLFNSDQEGCLKMTFTTMTLTNNKGKVFEVNMDIITAYTWQQMEYPTIKLKKKPITAAASLIPKDDDEGGLNNEGAQVSFANGKALCMLIQGRIYSVFPILPVEINKMNKILQLLLEKPAFDQLQFIQFSLFDKINMLKRSMGIQSNLANDHSKLFVNQKQIIQCLHSILQDKPFQSQYLLLLLEYSCGMELQVLKETINVLRQYWTVTYTEQRQLNILNCLARILSVVSQAPKSNVALVKEWLISMEDTLSPYQQYLNCF